MSKKNLLNAGRPSIINNRSAALSEFIDSADMKRINFQLPAHEHMKLKLYATRQGKTITELLTAYVTQLPGQQ